MILDFSTSRIFQPVLNCYCKNLLHGQKMSVLLDQTSHSITEGKYQ